MDSFIQKIWDQSRKSQKLIVFPEGTEDRILKATEEILKEKLAKIALIGEDKKIKEKAKKLGLEIDWKKVAIQNPKTSKLTKKYAETLYKSICNVQ